MQDDAFEWDDDKARSNLAKHKVTFDVARLAFRDAGGIDEPDDSMDYGEERFNRFGLVNGRLLGVTYCIRASRIRIITARKASKGEHETYFNRP